VSGNRDLTGSAARHHEVTGGNVAPREQRLPVGGDAARMAETEESIEEAHGIRSAPRDASRGARSMDSPKIVLPRVVGARQTELEKPKADLSKRTAADYLPPQLKAQLIAQGKLTPDGTLVERPAGMLPQQMTDATEMKSAADPPTGIIGSLTRFFRKLF
jgi:hypothetical protein